MAEPLGKQLARRYRLAAQEPDRNEHLRAAKLVQADPVLVVLRQGGRVENAVLVRLGQQFQCLTRVSRADSVRRDERAEQSARGHILRLKLGEFVAIHAVSEPVERSPQRQHGNLNHTVPPGVVIDPAQLLRMDEVLGIVDGDDLEARRVLLLVEQHPLIDPVETIGLGGRTIVRADREVDVREPRLQFAQRVQGRFVVRISAGKDRVLFVPDGREVVFEHGADHPMLVPQRDENGDLLLRRPLRRRSDWRLAALAAANPVQ